MTIEEKRHRKTKSKEGKKGKEKKGMRNEKGCVIRHILSRKRWRGKYETRERKLKAGKKKGIRDAIEN